MTTLGVDPGSLAAAAGRYDGIAGAIGQVLLSVRVHGRPWTGRADTTDELSAVLDGLARGLQVLATAAGQDADGLRAAATAYARTDAAVVRGR